jgi:hypothetical protein
MHLIILLIVTIYSSLSYSNYSNLCRQSEEVIKRINESIDESLIESGRKSSAYWDYYVTNKMNKELKSLGYEATESALFSALFLLSLDGVESSRISNILNSFRKYQTDVEKLDIINRITKEYKISRDIEKNKPDLLIIFLELNRKLKEIEEKEKNLNIKLSLSDKIKLASLKEKYEFEYTDQRFNMLYKNIHKARESSTILEFHEVLAEIFPENDIRKGVFNIAYTRNSQQVLFKDYIINIKDIDTEGHLFLDYDLFTEVYQLYN